MITPLSIEIKILDKRIGNQFPIPTYATEGSAGLDLMACISENLSLMPNAQALISSGISVFIQHSNYAGFLYPRSGLGHKHGIILGNSVGVIDSDYQGEIKISLWNRSETAFTIKPGDRIAQMVFQSIVRPTMTLVNGFSDSSNRGFKGFGHSGINLEY